MAARRDGLDAICFAAEGMSGTAGAAALRRVRALADQAPSGRMFAAIATLSEMARQSEGQLAAAQAELAKHNDHSATRNLSRAISTLDALAAAAQGEHDIPDLRLVKKSGRS